MQKIKLIDNEKAVKILFFLYMLGTSAFKRGYGFDAFFCRFTFIILMAYELFINILKNQKHRILLTPVFKWYFCFIVYYFISILWGNIDDGLYYVNNFAQIFGLCIVFTQHVKTKEDVLEYYKIIAFSLVVTAAVIILRTPISSWGAMGRLGFEELALNANALGIRYALGTVVCLYFTYESKLFYLPVVLFTAITLFSGSRTALVILVGGIVFYFIFKNVGFRTLRNIITIILAIEALFYLMFNIPVLYDTIGRRFVIYWNTANGVQTLVNGNVRYDYSAIERTYYREQAFRMFADSPIIGNGANSFVTKMREIGYSHVAYSHNTYLEILATLGLFGGILYFVPQLLTFFDKAKKAISEHNPYNAMCISLIVVIMLAQWHTITYIDPIEQSFIMLMIISTMNLNKRELQPSTTK